MWRLFLLLSLFICACSQDPRPPDFAYLLGADPETIDPNLSSGQPEGRVARTLFEGLTVNDPVDLHPIPGIARSWEVSPDGLVYTFHLRPSVWSDGRPVTAHDFAYAWERLLAPRTAARYATMLFPVKNAEDYNKGTITDPSALGFKAENDTTFVVTLRSPCAYFLDLCAFYTLLPVPRQTIEQYGDEWTKPENIVNNGPFLLEEWSINRRLRFVKNPRYWDVENVALNVADAITSDNINANFNLYMSGVLDWIDSGGVPLFVIPELLKRPDFHNAPYFNTYFYRFNVTRPPFNDRRVRKAFFLAMDAEAITKYVMRAGQEPAHSLIPPGIPGYTETQLPKRNLEEARRLLAEAGYPDGKGFPKAEVLFNTSEAHKQIAEVLQSQWKEALGVRVELVNQEWKVYLNSVQTLDYWMARGGWIGDYLDPNTFLEMWTSGNGNNRTGFADPGYDALIDRAGHTLDPQKRMALLREAEDWILEKEMIIHPIYYYVVMNMFDEADFSGLTPNLQNQIFLKAVKPLRGHRGHPRETQLSAPSDAAAIH
ncbi:MAG TPA: peptide ABC transporter substrate-binding protein [Candidatus Eisenbacteria bacterium]|nr:peptide ABC transporter substrate-binding protein [Candidatus Eisenbacteria bacterium]